MELHGEHRRIHGNKIHDILCRPGWIKGVGGCNELSIGPFPISQEFATKTSDFYGFDKFAQLFPVNGSGLFIIFLCFSILSLSLFSKTTRTIAVVAERVWHRYWKLDRGYDFRDKSRQMMILGFYNMMWMYGCFRLEMDFDYSISDKF